MLVPVVRSQARAINLRRAPNDLELIAQQVVVAFRAPPERLSHWLAHLARDAAGRQDEGRARYS